MRWSGVAAVAAFCVLLGIGSAAHAERRSVAVAVANVRGGPGTGHPVLWQVERFFPVAVLQRRDGWCYCSDYQGDRGWLHCDLLNAAETVVTRKVTCNVRSGPGTSHAVRFTVDDGIAFKVLGRQGRWINIVHSDGDRGWIHASLVW